MFRDKTNKKYLKIVSPIIISAVILCASSSLCACSSGSPADAAVSDSSVAQTASICRQQGHDYLGWQPDDVIGAIDSICRECAVCGEVERASGWMPVSELPPSSISQETISLAYKMPTAEYNALPDWEGIGTNFMGDPFSEINVDGKFVREKRIQDYAAYGFNYTRVTLNARAFFRDETMQEANYMMFLNLDNLLKWCIENNIHVSLNYNAEFGVDENTGRTKLFEDPVFQTAMYNFWAFMADRYKDVPSNALDFDLLNEPWEYKSVKQYIAIITETIDRIREVSPDKLITVEMACWAHDPIPELAEKKVIQAFHYYIPNSQENDEKYWTKDTVRAHIKRYADFSKKYDVGVILNECGAHINSPADDVAAWFDALFAACAEYNIPWDIHDYCGYYNFAGADRYCIRNDTPISLYVESDEYDSLKYVYPDILEALQRNMNNREKTLTADDFRKNLSDDAKVIYFAPRINFGTGMTQGDQKVYGFCEDSSGDIIFDCKNIKIPSNKQDKKVFSVSVVYSMEILDLSEEGRKNPINNTIDQKNFAPDVTVVLEITEAYFVSPNGDVKALPSLKGTYSGKNSFAFTLNDTELIKGSDFNGGSLVFKGKIVNLDELFALTK